MFFAKKCRTLATAAWPSVEGATKEEEGGNIRHWGCDSGQRAPASPGPGPSRALGMGNREGKKAEMECFPPGTPDWGTSAGCEGVGWVARVRAAVSRPPGAPGRVGMDNREREKADLRGFPLATPDRARRRALQASGGWRASVPRSPCRPALQDPLEWATVKGKRLKWRVFRSQRPIGRVGGPRRRRAGGARPCRGLRAARRSSNALKAWKKLKMPFKELDGLNMAWESVWQGARTWAGAWRAKKKTFPKEVSYFSRAEGQPTPGVAKTNFFSSPTRLKHWSDSANSWSFKVNKHTHTPSVRR